MQKKQRFSLVAAHGADGLPKERKCAILVVMPEPKAAADKKGTSDSLMHTFTEGKSGSSLMTRTLLIILVVAALLGIGTGYLLAQKGGKTGIASLDKVANSSKYHKGQVIGSDDTKTFKDTAEGEVKKGGVEDEGSHSLIRPGGETQTVCMTSSTVDLDALVGRKVKVWGQTNTPKTCGWLMDVGRVQVLD
jgi:hypothetical protein